MECDPSRLEFHPQDDILGKIEGDFRDKRHIFGSRVSEYALGAV